MAPKRVKVNVSDVKAVDDRTHMLERSEMYLPEKTAGPLATTVLTADMKLEKKTAIINLALIHLFLEVISNAADNGSVNGLVETLTQQLKGAKANQVEKICRESPARILVELAPDRMAVENYGAPFPIDFLKRDGKQYLIPYACFAIPKVGSNFDASKPRLGTGRYGCGAKTVPTCSRSFFVECVDAIRFRYYSLRWMDNADPTKIEERVWPLPQQQGGEFFIPDSNRNQIPSELREKFAKGSYTRVEWWPDLEIGDLTSKHVEEFGKMCAPGDVVRIRRCVNRETEEICATVARAGPEITIDLDQSRRVSLCTATNIRHLSNATKGISMPSGRLFFRGSTSITDDEINLAARYAMDFTLCGVPFVLRRQWSTGKRSENILCPLTPLEYGKLLFGTVPSYSINWVSSDNKAQVLCNAAFFDTPGAGDQVGFVNGVCTQSTGIHITAASNAFFGPIKHSSGMQKYAANATLVDMKRHVSAIVVCVGSDPSQKGQTKESLSEISGRKSFTMGSIPQEDAEKLGKTWDGFKRVMESGKNVEIGELREKIKKGPIYAYVPANTFGPNSTIVWAEGDSCLTYANVAKNMHPKCNEIGILSMRGVPPNLYESDCARMLSNRLFASIIRAMNIDPLKTYETEAELKTLRYGTIVFMGDPDLDGFHIIAIMLANLLHYWPFLFSQRRIGALRTPVVRVWNNSGTQVLARYYSDEEYNRAAASGEVPRGDVKRIKGLGSVECGSLDKPGLEIQDDMHHAPVMWFDMTAEGAEAIRRFFAKGQSAARKTDITRTAATCLDMTNVCSPSSQTNVPPMSMAPLLRRSVDSYIYKELVQYSLGSLKRQIPALWDGFKDVQRKIVAWLLKHHNFGKTNDRHKVESMAGRIASEFDYHHGQTSLGSAIKRMAIVGFPGANNVPFFTPKSGMGSRNAWPGDCPADRYAMVAGASWIPYAFKKYIVEAVPKLESDEGPIEPAWIPCTIPFTLMNGVFGVATGWRTYVPPCHPTSIFNFLRELASADSVGRTPQPEGIVFWYSGFKGSIEIKRGVMASLRKDDFNHGMSDMQQSQGRQGQWEQNEYMGEPDEDVCLCDDFEEPTYADKGIEFTGLWRYCEPARVTHTTVLMLEISEVPPELRLEKLNIAIQTLEKDGHVTSLHHSTQKGISYKLGLSPSGAELGRTGQLEKILGLRATYPLTNIFFLNEYGAPIKFDTVEDYLRTFYTNIIGAYAAGIRKLISDVLEKIARVEMQVRFIEACIRGEIRLGAMKRGEIMEIAARLNVDLETVKHVKSYDANLEGLNDTRIELNKLFAELERLRSLKPCDAYLEDLNALEKHVPTCPVPVKTGLFTWVSAER